MRMADRSRRRHIVFDFGAVVFRWQPVQMLMRELPLLAPDAAAGAHWAAQIFQSYGGDWADFDRGTVSVPDLLARITRRTGLGAAEVQTAIDGVARELQAQPEMVRLLQALHAAGHPLHYLSNMPAPIADQLEARNPFMACFDSGVFSGRVGLIKPEPSIYRLAAERFGAAPEDLVFIDDHPPNIAAARALGWDGFVFRSAEQTATELARRDIG
jgi:putative hydrolase of the HAD superfamily